MKKIEHKCKNRKLFDPEIKRCSIIILHEGKKIHIPVDPDDFCFFEETLGPENDKFQPIEIVKEVKMWVEDPKTGKKAKKGKVKIEYPEDFFGKPIDI